MKTMSIRRGSLDILQKSKEAVCKISVPVGIGASSVGCTQSFSPFTNPSSVVPGSIPDHSQFPSVVTEPLDGQPYSAPKIACS